MSKLGLLIAFVSALAATAAVSDAVILQKTGRQIQVVSAQDIGRKSRKEFRQWRKNPNYFGAIIFNSLQDRA
ncbi:hypothetical protein [uncultured Tateyamaria sp.]|uniref:hypothetical protein n=1 Tax=Tateyamaria sp. 1078 TaxID=3417464 RepID=UPI00261FD9BF|nr:hypothetical protein [uncultured Tateyamaria sp.]